MTPVPGLGGLMAVPGGLVGALRTLSEMRDRLDDVARFTGVLPAVARAIDDVAADTTALPDLEQAMTEVAGATRPLPEVA